MTLVGKFVCILLSGGVFQVSAFSRKPGISHQPSRHPQRPVVRTVSALSAESSSSQTPSTGNRRTFWIRSLSQAASVTLGAATLAILTKPAWASSNSRSRTEGYAVQKDEADWKSELSPLQYEILRQGGTERPFFSILESEKKTGVFKCAGCGTPLFDSKDKFNSGTGWPSFARGLADVEVEDVPGWVATLAGAELRCGTCGGHLGDVFRDGALFPGTEAAVTNRRFCIDGAALVFYPEDGTEPVRGDQPSAAAAKRMAA